MRLGLRRVWMAAICTLVLSSACAPSPGPSPSGGAPASGPAEAPTTANRSPKVLTLAVTRELKGFGKFTGVAAGGGNPGAGNNQIAKMGHNYLAVETESTGTF